MKPLLLLDGRYTPDGTCIWKEAIRRGWNTERTDKFRIKEHIAGREHVRYYGNTLHVKQIEDQLPFTLTPIDYSILAKVPEYTKRKIDYIRFETLGQPIKQHCFIKPARDKWFEAKVYNEGDLIAGSPLAGDEIYVSEIKKYMDEVRCFVLDGEVQTSSLYRIGSIVWDQTNENPEDINFDTRINDTPIPQMIKMICAKHKLPRGVVIDFGYDTNREWSLIEFNEAWASGLYYCNPEKCFDVIEASQH